MLRLLLFFTILEFALCSCPDGFELVVNGQCRQLNPYGTKNGRLADGLQTAISRCNEFEAQPIIIRNDEEQAYWNGHKQSSDRIILGIVCNTTSKRYQWTDGSAINYKPPAESNDITAACTTGGTWYLYYDDGTGRWLYYAGSNTAPYDVYCITQLQQPVLSSDSCLGFYDDEEDEICYQIGATAENWQDAQMACKQVGANLASIHNTNENAFIRRLAVSAGAVHGVFLGATITGKGDSYGWIDGSAWDYENFYPGFHGIGDCIAMDTSNSTGPWMNVDCTAKLPVACVRERKTIEQKNVTCNVQTFAENTIITSPGFPTDASLPCEYFLTVDAGKKVEMEIVLLEANSCCDFLILDEGYFGGFEMAKLTGELRNVTYRTSDSNIMKVSWQPNGGVNVRGMAITFRGV